MAYCPTTLAFFSTADVMQQGGGGEDVKLRLHLPADGHGGVQHPFTVIGAM
jgi:hypothetical protein